MSGSNPIQSYTCSSILYTHRLRCQGVPSQCIKLKCWGTFYRRLHYFAIHSALNSNVGGTFYRRLQYFAKPSALKSNVTVHFIEDYNTLPLTVH